ncbi:Leucine-, isoleucine-, valine-, threonine-, and alanine-binding protein precursor [Variovorax sp. PBS-H4]|uniref:ABC transporter substrate-binding protein n=1 Tax=Variovorax sp. PBS-H4 TaxID=434008 RepID=UPI001315BBCB|nr:ABC transporter substrate-binding protein [Variovorax sp. PBS-H4]VTU36509.1 Leucine-, isoleucine-, valine-, threonine-, and alanine-binding protein precursor [Variovorax sp. PBS-H4]
MSKTASAFNRRHILQAAGGAAAAIAAPPLFAQSGGTIKLGSLLPRQGPFALQGEATTMGIKVALDQANHSVIGRKVEWVAYDEPNPLGAQQNMQKLAQEDKVAAVIGGSNSATGLAIASVAAQQKMPTIISAALAKEITGKNCNRYVFRNNGTPIVYARLLAQQLLPRGKKWYFLVGNYAYGHEAYQMLKSELLAAGGQDVGMDAASVGTTDFSSIILKIRQARPDVIALGIAGTDLTAFLKQYDEFGMRGKIPLGSLTIGDEEIWAQPNPSGIMGKYWHFNNPQNSPEERALNQTVLKATGRPASQSCAQGWICARMILAAIEKEGSAEPAAIVRGLETVRPAGVPGYFREWDHQFITRLVCTEVREKVTDKYDALRIIGKPMTPQEMEPLYGSKEEVGCTLGSL